MATAIKQFLSLIINELFVYHNGSDYIGKSTLVFAKFSTISDNSSVIADERIQKLL